MTLNMIFASMLAAAGLVFGAAGPAAADPPVEVIAFGDSLTAGFGIGQEKAYPALLQRMFQAKGHAVRMINAGVSGDTTAGGLSRLAWTLEGVPKARAAILALGANDMLRGMSPEQAEANLDAMLVAFKAKGIRVLLCGMIASANLGPDYKRRFDAIYPRLAAKHQVALYPFLLAGVAQNPALNQSDGTHPNPEGARLIAKNLFPMVMELVKPFLTIP